MDTRPLTPDEKRVLLAGLAGMQPPPPAFREKPSPRWFFWVLLGAGLGWMLIGLIVLAITGLLMAVAP
jgi:hypothetical protein